MIANAMVLATAGGALAAGNRNEVNVADVAPGGQGSGARPLPVSVHFGLRSRAETRDLRPLPTKTYILSLQGVVAFPRAFPACSLAKVKRRRGVPKQCRNAHIGRGLVKGAAGLAEDTGIEDSVPCNLKLDVYNLGDGLALRLDGEPPLPPSFESRKLGCPVPIHTAVRARFRSVTLDGLRSTELRFTVPKLLLHPLEGWLGALQVVDVALERRTTTVRLGGGRLRTVGYFSGVGCKGGHRVLEVVFVGLDGGRSEAEAQAGC